MASLKWSELSWTDFRDLKNKENIPVILPIGAVEQHGPHLPVGTDSYIGGTLSEAICNRLEDVTTITLPILWYSKSNEHSDFPGTIVLSHQTLTRLLDDICASVARSGFKKLVILNWHGGNIDLLSVLCRDIHLKYGLTTFAINGGQLLSAHKSKKLGEQSFDIHAGLVETSLMLTIHPTLVKQDFEGLGSDFAHGKMALPFSGYRHILPEGGPILMGWVTKDLSIDGVVGDPTLANNNDGKGYYEAAVKLGCEILREISQFHFSDK